MSFSINTNVASLESQNYLNTSTNFQNQTIQEVSSGLRIVNSGDDAAGLAVANGMASDEAVLTQGIQNANNGLATLQTVDGGMNNISTLLNRASTLAAESASGTFTGDRSTLNSEFQSVITEISRQAQAIGMNQGGQFAQDLSVFIGGGKGTTQAAATTDGSINLNLSQSTVDAQSLGLQGVQAEGNTNVDLSDSSTTSVQSLIGNASNQASETAAGHAGYANFVFSGPGFADGNAVTVSVNLANVTDTGTLAAAINQAIASTTGSAAATAFKNSNISASIVQTAGENGSVTQQLAFSSVTAGFKVQAGDQTANALLGNISSGTTGAATTTTFTAGANLGNLTTKVATQPTTITVQFQGAGLTQPATVTVGVTANETLQSVITSLTSQVSVNSTLAKAGISVVQPAAAGGSPLTFQSTSGQQFSVTTGNDLDNLLGLGSTRLGGPNSTVQYSTISGGSAYNDATAQGTAHFQVALNGGTAIDLGDVNLSAGAAAGGDATAGTLTGAVVAGGTVNTSVNNQLSVAVDGTTYAIDLTKEGNNSATESLSQVAADITTQLAAQGSTATATVNSTNQLTITSGTTGAASSVVIGNAGTTDAAAALSLTSATGGAATAGLSRSGANIATYLQQQINGNATLQAAGLQATFADNKFTIASNNNTLFQLNAYADSTQGTITGAAGGNAVVTGTDTSSQVITSLNQNLDVTVDSKTYQVQLQTGTRTTAQMASDIQTALTAQGSTATATTDAAGHIVIASGTAGVTSNVSIGALTNPDSAASVLGLSGLSGSGTAATAATSITGTTTTLSGIQSVATSIVGDSSTLTGAFVASTAATTSGTSANFTGSMVADAAAADITASQLSTSALTTNTAATPATGSATFVSTAAVGFTADAVATAVTGTVSNAGTVAGLGSGSYTNLNLTIDGVNHIVDLTGVTNIAGAVTAINTAFSPSGSGNATVATDTGNAIVLNSNTTGHSSNITVTAGGTNDASTLLGLTTNSVTNNVSQGAGSYLNLTIDGVNRTVDVGSATLTVAQTAARINTAFTTAASASNPGSGNAFAANTVVATGTTALVLNSTATGASSNITVGASAAATTLGLSSSTLQGVGFTDSQAAAAVTASAAGLNTAANTISSTSLSSGLTSALVADAKAGNVYTNSAITGLTFSAVGGFTADAMATVFTQQATVSAADTLTAALTSSSTLNMTVDGVTADVSNLNGVTTGAGLVAAINNQFGYQVATDVNGLISFQSTHTGHNSQVVVNSSNIAGLSAHTGAVGAGSYLGLTIDGTTKNVDIGTTAIGAMNITNAVSAIATAINTAFLAEGTVANANAGVLTLNSNVTGPTSAITVAGNGSLLNLSGNTTGAGSSLNLTIDGVNKTVDLGTAALVTASTNALAASDPSTPLVNTAMNGVAAAINSAFGQSVATYNDTTGKIAFNSNTTGAESQVQLTSGGLGDASAALGLTAATHLGAGSLTASTAASSVFNGTSLAAGLNGTFVSDVQATSVTASAAGLNGSFVAGSNLNLTIDGVQHNVALGGLTTLAQAVTAINTAFNPVPADVATNSNGLNVASVNGSGDLVLNSNAPGGTSQVKVTTGGVGDASSILNLSAVNNTGTGSNLALTVDGVTKNIDLGTNAIVSAVATANTTPTPTNINAAMAAIVGAINNSTTGFNASVAAYSNGTLTLNSQTTGANSNVTLTTGQNNDASSVLYLAAANNVGVQGSHLDLSIDGITRQVNLASAGGNLSTIAADINGAFTNAATDSTYSIGGSGAAFTTGTKVAVINAAGQLQLNSTTNGAASNITVDTTTDPVNNAAAALNLTATSSNRVLGSNLNLTIDGTQRTVDLSGVTNAAQAVTAINTAFTTASSASNVGTGAALTGSVASVNLAGELQLNSTLTGATSVLQLVGGQTNDASGLLGLTAAHNTGNAGSTLSLDIQGTTKTVDVSAAKNMTDVMNAINTAYNPTNAANGNVATLSASGALVLTSGTTGSTSTLAVNSTGSYNANSVVGLTSGTYNGAAGSHLDLEIDGVSETVDLSTAKTMQDAVNLVNAAYTGLGTVASINTNGAFQLASTITGGGTTSQVKLIGGGTNDAAGVLNLGAPVNNLGTNGVKNLSLTIDGTSRSVNLTNATNLTQVVADINTAFTTTATGATTGSNPGTGAALLANVASLNANGELALNSTLTGYNSSIQVGTPGTSDATTAVGLLAAEGGAAVHGVNGTGSGSVTGGNQAVMITSSNNVLDLSVNGTQVTVNLTKSAANTPTTMSQIASQINTAFANAASGPIAAVASAATGNLVITSTTSGGTSNVTIGGTDAFDGATIAGLVGQTDTAPATFAITKGVNDTLSFKVDGNATQSITLTAGASLSATQISSDINAKLAAANITGVAATVSNGTLLFQTEFSGSGHSVQVVNGNDSASTILGLQTTTNATGTDANVGFGFTGSQLTSSGTGTTLASSPDVLSGGGYQSAGLSFSALAYGSDSQVITVTANDASGASHTTNVTLSNSAAVSGGPGVTNGASIDSAVNAINTQLQQSNDSALQSVTAVTYNNNGAEQIKLISANTKFSVNVASTGSGTGVGSQGTTVSANTIVGTGGTADISTEEGAQLAVNALTSAVQDLGIAQAAVGKGENLLNYATSLAQSQNTNEAAAESQIRDANLAMEAANLTKAQILTQAGVAALAQANSAPQTLLKLLQ